MDALPMIQTAAEIGSELSQYVQRDRPAEEEQARIREYVALLVATPGLSLADALAFSSLAESLTRQASVVLGDDHADAGMCERAGGVLVIASALSRRANEVLELHTGLARESFSDAARILN